MTEALGAFTRGMQDVGDLEKCGEYIHAPAS
jgi:hypothetical protein